MEIGLGGCVGWWNGVNGWGTWGTNFCNFFGMIEIEIEIDEVALR